MVPQDSPTDTPNGRHSLNLSPERIATARSWIAGNRDRLTDVTHSARIMAAVGLLICDDCGRIARGQLDSAMTDPNALSYAETLISEVFS